MKQWMVLREVEAALLRVSKKRTSPSSLTVKSQCAPAEDKEEQRIMRDGEGTLGIKYNVDARVSTMPKLPSAVPTAQTFSDRGRSEVGSPGDRYDTSRHSSPT
mmetsp:Transcript_5882/g.13967  ORF Transcript_5882/g.13967 Transcript_5882/m.13967 type:complete len:103 (-) Transcript_5882:688-996(-)